ncbi:MAG: VCBS repeat-containing protein, partial [Verrucomicrobiales bacterium]
FIASLGHGKGVVWFEAPEWKRHDIHATIQEPHSLIVLDFDGDGDQDAATCAFGSKEAYWFENDGKGSFTNHLVAKDQEAYDIRASDLDGDGDLDLLIAGRGSRNVAWYENPKR